jgi:precorrin-6A/cobalt-precorrin-6A reductase
MAHGSPLRVLILGGTAEASALARLLAEEPQVAPVLSFAGRTAAPVLPPIPSRIGGFGGAEGLAAHLTAEGVDLLIDATHPFAARISANAERAASLAGVPRLVLQRPPWVAAPGDDWRKVPTVEAAALALGAAPRRVFLTIGRQDLLPFRAQPQHRYIIRSVDPPDPALLPPGAAILTGRGPFAEPAERSLMAEHGAEVLVTKNSGGADGKLRAARSLGLPVIMIDRKPAPSGETVPEAAAALAWIRAHAGSRLAARGA